MAFSAWGVARKPAHRAARRRSSLARICRIARVGKYRGNRNVSDQGPIFLQPLKLRRGVVDEGPVAAGNKDEPVMATCGVVFEA